MEQPAPQGSSLFDRIKRSEDTRFGVIYSWTLVPVIFTLAGFYMGTIFGSPHVKDLQLQDIHNGFLGAGIGFAAALVWAIAFTALYPAAKEREEALEDAKHH